MKMVRRTQTPHQRAHRGLARWVRASHLLLGGLVLLVAFGGFLMFKENESAHAHAESELAAAQLGNDLDWISGLVYEAQSQGWTPTISGDYARRSARIHSNLRILDKLGLDETSVVALTAEANHFLATVDKSLAGFTADPTNTGGLKALPVDPTQISLHSESVVLELQRSAIAAAGPRKWVIILTLPAIALLVGVMLWWDGRRTRRAELIEADAASHARFETMVEEGSDLVMLVDQGGTVSYVSSSLMHVLGVAPGTWLGQQVPDLIDPDYRPAVAEAFQSVALTGKCQPMDVRFLHADGTQRLLELTATDLSSNPQIGSIVWHARDVTDRRRLEDELGRQAFRDSLTGLANRALFHNRLTQALACAALGGERVAVLMLDLDGFKTINDTLGHDAGDDVLVEVAARLGASVRPGDTVARLGGDEFVILLEHIDTPWVVEDVVDVVAARVLRYLGDPLDVGGSLLCITASIGSALLGDEAMSPEQLLHNADIAMYEAKSRGHHNHVCFESRMHEPTLL